MTRSRLVDDCFQAAENLMSHESAIAELKARITPVAATETVPLNEASGRLLAESMVAPMAVPGHANAAVDGYAFAHKCLKQQTDTTLAVAGRSAAGVPFSGTVGPGEVIRILTGAVVPEGCDTVVMQEDVRAGTSPDSVIIPARARPGANIRPAGEDVSKDSVLFEGGHKLRPQDVATLASIGVGEVSCFGRLRVGIISTGDEIVTAGTGPLELGNVYDANTPMLAALVSAAGGTPCPLGIWPDKPDLIKNRLKHASSDYDVLLSSGGASQGDEDHLATALDQLGRRHFWRIAVKPGRPIMFGQIGGVPVVGLPGNPVAVFVCFLMYVFPMLRRMGGGTWPEPRRYQLPAEFTVAKRKPGRREFWRGSVVETDVGTAVDKFPKDGSGLISSLRHANGLIDMPEDIPSVAEGDMVNFIPFSEFGILS